MIFAITFSNKNVDKVMNPVNLFETHKTALYEMYDVYWDTWLIKAVNEGILNNGFGYSGEAYYWWLIPFLDFDSNEVLKY